MNRHELAEECVLIEEAGESVRDYLASCGCISPWGTWWRLQKEELNRKDWQITDGRGGKRMGSKLTLEQKKKAVEIAIDGGNPLKYLKSLGLSNPSASWILIRKKLKTADPEKYARLPDRANAKQSGDRLKEAATETVEAIKINLESEPEIVKPVNYGGFDVMAVRSAATEFRYEYDMHYGMMTWRTEAGDEVRKTPGEWHNLATELQEVMLIFGI